MAIVGLVPELPEAERARQTLSSAVGRRIVGVDDSDSYVCRPHAPGEIADVAVGQLVTSARRQGKFLWLETEAGPVLGLHLGMSGRVVRDPARASRWDRFALELDDGHRLVLRDKRRLGRAVLDPDHSRLGPDAAEITREQFRIRVGTGRAPVKARLLDQAALAGVGNLLADEALWLARLAPSRPVGELSSEELDRLRRCLRAAIRSALARGGVHTGKFARARKRVGSCPRDAHVLERARIGGRTTIWCPECQR